MAREWPWQREELTKMWTWPQTFWMTLFNLWIEGNHTPNRRRFKLFTRAFGVTYAVLFNVSIFFGAVANVSSDGVLEHPISISQAAAGTICVFKLVEITRNKKDLRQAMIHLDELTEEVKEPEDVVFMKKAIFRLWVIYILNMIDVLVTMIHWNTRPLIVAALYQERTSAMNSYINPLDTWTQFTFNTIAQNFVSFYFAIGLSLLDNIYLCICQYVISHMDLLKKNLEDLHLSGEQIETIKLTKIIKRHVKILRVCKELKNASGQALTLQIVMTVLVICTGVFALTMNDQLSLNLLMNLLEIMFLLTIRLFLFAWFSIEVTLSCRSLGISAYRSGWISGSEMQKKELMILVSNTMKPVVFGGLIQIDFDTCLMVFKTAFSYYNFLLASFQEKTGN